MPASSINSLDLSVLKGCQSDDGDVYTVEATVPTGMEDVCAEEVLASLGVHAVVSLGRAFFDIQLHLMPKVLSLRSVENVHVVVHVDQHFGFTQDRISCFKSLYHLAMLPSWRKGVRALSTVTPGLVEPFVIDRPLVMEYQEPNPILDLKMLKDGSPVALNLPQDIQAMRKQNKEEVEQQDKEELEQLAKEDHRNQQNETKMEDHKPNTDTSKRKNLDDCNTGDTIKNQNNGSESLESNLLPGETSLDDIINLDKGKDTSTTDSSSSGIHNKCNSVIATAAGDCGSSLTETATNNFSSDSADDNMSEELTKCRSPPFPSFRVTCKRSGEKHVFGSPEGARQLGGAINERFDWRVDLTNSDIEVLLDISGQVVIVSLCVTREAMCKRNLVSFGPTNLRATLCYALVHLAQPKLADTVLDHMCGGAGISIEGSLAYPNCFHLGGDVDPRALNRARSNLDHNSVDSGLSVPADAALWDTTSLPLRNSCVDVIVSDLPFGKRSGSRFDNRVLYLKALQETARVTRPKTGRAVLLTHDKTNMIKNLDKVKDYWKKNRMRLINIGGLSAAVFILMRTGAPFSQAHRKENEH